MGKHYPKILESQEKATILLSSSTERLHEQDQLFVSVFFAALQQSTKVKDFLGSVQSCVAVFDRI